MTTTVPEDIAPGSTGPELRLGRDVVRRMRLPGPPVGRPLPTRIGSLASSVSRFAAATSRPVDIRRALVGPDPRGLSASSAPPRWWTPSQHGADAAPEAAPSASSAASWLAAARPVTIRRLPERGLPRAARGVPDEASYTPGGILGNLRGEAIRVRRIEEVAAVGPMLMTSDRAKLNAGLAARARQSAPPPAATPATPAIPAIRRATTGAPRQPATPAAPRPTSEPSTAADPAPAAPAAPAGPAGLAGGEQATVRRTTSVADSPPTGTTTPPAPPSGAPATVPDIGSVADSPPAGTPAPPAPPSGASATVPDIGSVADSPPTGTPTPPAPPSGASATVPDAGSVAGSPPPGTPAPAPALRRATRPPWQLRSRGSRFDGLVRRAPARHLPDPSFKAGAPGLSTTVSPLASADRTPLSSGLRRDSVVSAAGPTLIASGADAPATARRHAWSAGSIVMRQAAGGGGRAASQAAPTPRAPRVDAPTDRAAAAATASTAAPAPAGPAARPVADATSATAGAVDPVVRRLPHLTGPTSAAPAATAAPAIPGPGPEAVAADGPARTPDLRRLPRLWRRASEIRPATDVRSSTPAPLVRIAATGAPASSGLPTTSDTPAAAPGAAPDVRRSPASPSAPTPATQATPAALATAAALAPSTATPPLTRVGAHVASPGVTRAAVAMPELMTIRRATAHGTDPSRALATGFGAPETIRPASAGAATLGTAPGRTATSVGETRLWRRPGSASGATGGVVRRSASATPAVRRSPAAPGSTPAPIAATPTTAPSHLRSPGRPAWQPWSESAGPAPAPAAFPAGPPGAASAPSGRRPAADIRRLTVAPPRIGVAPQQPPAPPVPDVARTGAPGRPSGTGAAASTTVRRSTGQSLIDATAHLFTTPERGTPERPAVRRSLEGDTAMALPLPPPPPAPSSLPVPASSLEIAHNDGDLGEIAGPPDQLLPGAGFEQVVDAVVERIERRVIDELERRGRWHGWGAR